MAFRLEELRKLAVLKNIPLSALFELTCRCNLYCIHCAKVEEKDKIELGYKEVCRILDQLADSGCLYLTLTGGEIFTRRDCLDIVSYARKKNFALRLFTNATLISKYIADRIKKIRPLCVEVSLYGSNAETYERITGVSGSYKMAMRGVRLLSERNIRVILKSPVMKENFDDIWNIRKVAERFPGMHFSSSGPLITPKDDRTRGPLNCRISDCMLEDFISKEYFLRRDVNDQQAKKIEPERFICLAGKRTVAITAYGDVLPCVLIRIKEHNLREKSFSYIWKNSVILNFVRSLKRSNLSICKDCSFRSFCLPCPGLNFLEEGSLTIPSKESCRIAMIRKRCYEKVA